MVSNTCVLIAVNSAAHIEWVKPTGERVVMTDDDPAFSKVESDHCKRLVTLQCYKITDNATVALTPRHHVMDSKSSLPKHGELVSNFNIGRCVSQG